MIHTLYDHGDERPAADLSLAQLRAARSDAAGVLWIDLDMPTEEELTGVLVGVFGMHPAIAAMLVEPSCCAKPMPAKDSCLVLVQSSAAHAAPAGSSGRLELGTLALFVGSNFVVTVHHEPWPALDALREAVAAASPPLARGSDRLAADVLAAIARYDRERLDAASTAIARIAERLTKPADAASLADLAAARSELGALRREIRQQADVATYLATEAVPAIRVANRLYFAVAGSSLASSAQRADVLADAANDLADGQRTLLVAEALRSTRWRSVLLASALVSALVALLIVLAFAFLAGSG